MTTAASASFIHSTYIVVLGRPADAVALQTYGAMLDAGPGNESKVVLAVLASDEAQNIYSKLTVAQMIDVLYGHMFGKPADVVLRDRLAAQIENGSADMEDVFFLIVSPQGASEAATISAKIAAANTFMAQIDTPVDVQAYRGERANDLLRDYLDNVRDAPTLAAATTPVALNALLLSIGAVAPAAAPVLIDIQVQEMYIAFFGRAADFNGLKFWTGTFNGKPSDATQETVAAAFGNAQEYRDTYGGKTSAVMVDTVYKNLFGRSGETAGVDYWSSLLDKGAIGLHNVVKAIAEGARGSDLFAYDAKVTVASAISAQLDTPAETIAYGGNAANKLVYAYIARVKDAVTFTAAVDPLEIKKLIDSMLAVVPQALGDAVVADAPPDAVVLVGAPVSDAGNFYY